MIASVFAVDGVLKSSSRRDEYIEALEVDPENNLYVKTSRSRTRKRQQCHVPSPAPEL